MLIAVRPDVFVSAASVRKIMRVKDGVRVVYIDGETEFFEDKTRLLDLDNQTGPVIPNTLGMKVAVCTMDENEADDQVSYYTPVGFRVNYWGHPTPIVVDDTCDNEYWAFVEPTTNKFVIPWIGEFEDEAAFKTHARAAFNRRNAPRGVR